jgi:ketosteroid isomerase-like protein
MSAETREIVERIQASLAEDVVAALADEERDREIRATLAELAEPDFQVVMVGPGYTSVAREARGFDGFREAWGDWTSPFATFRIEVEEMLDAGDKVVSLVRQEATTKTGGVPIEAEAAAVWTIANGRLHRVEFHIERESAMRSAGLA